MARPCRHTRASAVECTDAFDCSDVPDAEAVVLVRMHVCPSCGAAWLVRRIERPGAVHPVEQRVTLTEGAVARVHAGAGTHTLDLRGLIDLEARSPTALARGLRSGRTR